MKVLFIADGLCDYQSDTIFHGLYDLLGADFTHSNEYHFMYREQTNVTDLINRCSGRGFTMWGHLPKYYNDNSDLESKIKNKLFDYIIYGSIRRNKNYLELVKQYYPKNKICFIEGEDCTGVFDTDGIILFKRELVFEPTTLLRPISFGIPPKKIVTDTTIINKTRDIAEYIPSSPGTGYIFENEDAYYNNYKTAKFGITKKKSGWDCMRHYEILANYCIPLFENLDACPSCTMVNFPKEDIININRKFISNDLSHLEYNDVLNKLFEYTKINLTTTAITKYVLDTLKNL